MKANITKAILGVMNDVKGIDKTMVVGTGQMSYKGVSDQEVKKVIGTAMIKHGLVMLPIEILSSTKTSDWEEETQYGIKRKQSTFTQVNTKYLLMHESGESIEICGYGQGVDSQDKGAGKATTYALKYALLYAFLVPTGRIDDTDSTHSNDIEIKTKKVIEKPAEIKKKGAINTERFMNALNKISLKEYTVEALKATFELNDEQNEIINELKNEKE